MLGGVFFFLSLQISRFFSYYHWLLGQQYLERSAEHPDLLPKYEKAAQQAEHFYAYEAVFMYCVSFRNIHYSSIGPIAKRTVR